MRWLGLSLLVAASAVAIPALGDDDVLDAPQPRATIRIHTYSLAECLALAERNHPNLWAARARLAYARAQLSEARYTPFFTGWSLSATGGVLPPITGSPFFTSSTVTAKNISGFGGLEPFGSIDFGATIPLYTFGKITNSIDAADANIRVSEWDLEKNRQQTRMDVRRAYFGIQFARDARVVIADALERLKKGVDGMRQKADRGERGVHPTDVYRLEAYYEEVNARSGDPVKGETFALAALRFMTGVQTAFDVVDEPLKRPDRPIVPVTRYLAAARVFRPEINMARAGVVARERIVDYTRARYFPDFGVGLGFSYAIAPSATQQTTAWSGGDPFNHFYYAAAFGMRWSLDAITNTARVAEAESNLEETRALERLAMGGVMVEVENAHGTVVEAKNREEAWGRAEDKGKQWIATVQDSIDLGTDDERALLEPLRVWGNARINHLQALMDLNVALADLARVSGWDGAAPTGE